VQLISAPRVRNAKSRDRLFILGRYGGVSEDRSQRLRSWPLHSWSTSEATLVGISRAYRLIRFRCQQAPL